jgi:hypothetical protein
LPTYAWLARFAADFDSLSPEQQALFLAAIAHFVDDLSAGKAFRRRWASDLRVRSPGSRG